MATALDFFASGETALEESRPVEQAEQKTTTVVSPGVTETTDDNTEEILGEISTILMPKAEEEETPKAEGEKQKEEKTGESTKTVLANPYQHSPRLLLLADSQGISADEAYRYPTEESLLLAVSQRENRKLRAEMEGRAAKKVEPEDELPLPEFDLDEDTDPKIKKALESMRDYSKKLKEYADARVKEKDEEIEIIKTEREQAAVRESRTTQAKIVRALDEEVASWGGEFTDLLGVPSQSLRGTGDQREKAQELNQYVTQLQLGYVALNGQPDPEDAVRITREFVRQARYALWPEMAQKTARKEVATGLKKQKGGVAMRPGSSRSEIPPEQGDRAAKAAIGDYYSAHGLDPWSRKNA